MRLKKLPEKIVCFGDSNTYGYDARSLFGDSFPTEQQWPHMLAAAIGAEVINCGMNGRMIPHGPRSVAAEISAVRRYLPCDLLIIMLGSNDILNGVYRSAGEMADALKVFLHEFMRTVPEADFLLIAPPKISFSPEMKRLSLQMAPFFAAAAAELGICFADSDTWGLSLAWDEVHFTAEGHRIFAEHTAEIIRTLAKES